MSPAEEARSARDLVDYHEGDHAAVAKELAWSSAKLKSRLALLKCSEEVLSALDEGLLSAVHAELLSTLPHTKQNQALPRILTEKISVAQLREELQGYAIPLSSAPFDTTKKCGTCEFNSEAQLSLFGQPLDTARCSNKPCFTKLSTDALNAKRTELLDEFATVALYTEKDQASVTTVQATGPNGVGEVQLATGCKGCKFFGVTIEDRLVPNIGEVRRNMCFDAQGCHKEKVAAYRSLIATPVVVEESRGTGAVAPSKSTAVTSTSSKKVQTTKAKGKVGAKALPGTVVSFAEKFYQNVASQLVSEDVTAALAFALLATVKLPMPNNTAHPLDKAAPVKSITGNKEKAALRVAALAKLDQAQLLALAQRIVAESAKATQTAFNPDFDSVGISRSLVAAKEIDLSQHFTMDKTYLDANTLAGVECVLDESGFTKWFTETNPDGEKGFKKLIGGRKSDVIARVLAAGFDWKGYVPEALRSFRTKPAR